MLKNFIAMLSFRSSVFSATYLALFPSILLIMVAPDVFAHSCGAKNWKYEVGDLQEARRRLGSDQIQTQNTRVDCAESILGSPGLADPSLSCAECGTEFAGLLADAAVYMRRASDKSTRAKQTYLLKEVDIRRRLTFFLTIPDNNNIKPLYFDSNLLALADAMERTGEANEYHQLISELTETRTFDRQIYRVWIKAVRSCSVWDFKSVENMDKLKESLCNKACINDLQAVYQGLQDAGLLQTDGSLKTSLPPMPIPKECN